MTTSRLMTSAVFALGVLMVIVGLYSVNYGLPIVRMEMGWTAVVAGSVAASAGGVILAVGVLLGHVVAIRTAIERLAEPAFPIPASVSMGERYAEEEAAPQDDEGRFEAPPLDLRPLHPLSPAARREPPPPAAEVKPEPALAVLLHPIEDTETPAPPAPVVHHQPEPIIREGAPALAQAGEDESARASPPIPAPDAVVDAVADAPLSPAKSSTFLSSLLSRRSGWTTDARRPPAPAGAPTMSPVEEPAHEPPPRTPVDLSSGWERDEAPPPHEDVVVGTQDPPAPPPVEDYAPEPPHHPEPLTAAEEAPAAVPAPEPEEPPAPEPVPEHAPSMIETPAPEEPPAPVVVGRYNAGSASYVMYSNGMIEVETEHGTHQFASMQELKRFIERRDTRVS